MKARTIILLVLSILLLSAGAYAETVSGTCGEGLNWTFTNGALTITGEGAMADYSTSKKAPWKGYEVQTVEIGSGVISVGKQAFDSCTELTEVILPEGLSSIGPKAFYACTALTSVSVPNSVTDIGSYAFGLCEGLSQVTLSDSLSSIGDHAFYNCAGLSYICVPDSVTTIKNEAFAGSGLRNIRLSERLDTMGTAVFERCVRLEEIIWPASMKRVPLNTFFSSSINTFILQEGTTKIERNSFQSCEQLREIYLPVSLTMIDDYAFDGCSCLTDIYYAGTEQQKTSMTIVITNSVLTEATWHYAVSGDCARGIHHLQNGSCTNCHQSFDISGMTAVSLPEDLMELEAEALRGIDTQVIIVPAGCAKIGSCAFADCPNLQYVLLPEGVTLAADALSGTAAELLYR